MNESFFGSYQLLSSSLKSFSKVTNMLGISQSIETSFGIEDTCAMQLIDFERIWALAVSSDSCDND